MTFDEQFRAAVRFRRVSRELESLVRDVHASLADVAALKPSLERLITFLTTEEGRTDANCDAIHHFFDAIESEWSPLPEPYRAILDDMSGTMRESIYRPEVARTFESLPEQLLERVRALPSS